MLATISTVTIERIRPDADIHKSRPVWVSFAGSQSIIVIGQATGRIYTFSSKLWQLVHGADRPGMLSVEGLRWRDMIE